MQIPDDPSDLKSQLDLHIHVLNHGSSLLQGYDYLASRAAVCQIIRQAPYLKAGMIRELMKSDRTQRVRLQISSASAKDNEPAFWRDFQDRYALVCEIVHHVRLIMILAPGMYELVLTVGSGSLRSLDDSRIRCLYLDSVGQCLGHTISWPLSTDSSPS
jgi:hypothetical protein